MRASVLSVVALLCLFPVVAFGASGSWGVFADDSCSISLFSSTFENGACGSQASGGKTIYYIVRRTIKHEEEARVDALRFDRWDGGDRSSIHQPL